METAKSNTTSKNEVKKKADPKRLYSLDTFIVSAIESPKYKDVSKITFAGFKSLMVQKDKQYVYDESYYVSELNNYIK